MSALVLYDKDRKKTEVQSLDMVVYNSQNKGFHIIRKENKKEYKLFFKSFPVEKNSRETNIYYIPRSIFELIPEIISMGNQSLGFRIIAHLKYGQGYEFL
jgi:hypothetical protein